MTTKKTNTPKRPGKGPSPQHGKEPDASPAEVHQKNPRSVSPPDEQASPAKSPRESGASPSASTPQAEPLNVTAEAVASEAPLATGVSTVTETATGRAKDALEDIPTARQSDVPPPPQAVGAPQPGPASTAPRQPSADKADSNEIPIVELPEAPADRPPPREFVYPTPTARAASDEVKTPDTPAEPETPDAPPAPFEVETSTGTSPTHVTSPPVAEVESLPESPPGPARPSMFIVHVTPEIAPVAKVGGLADVVFGLAKEQEIRGNHVEVVLPKYDSLRYDQIWGLTETYNDLWVPWYGGSIHCTVYFGFAHGRKCFFIEPHSADNFFNRGCVYGFNDDILRFAFFSRAALEFLWKSGKHPDIIHCHDWQTALVPVFLYEIYGHLGMTHPRVCFTIHNFKHQGVTGANLLHATGLNRPDYYFHYDRLRDNHNIHALNLTKGGIVYSNFITTVSPRHAIEAKDQGEGFGLEPTLHIHHQKYGGVLNGIDYEAWNPEIDRQIPFHYSVDHIDDKYRNKVALRDRLLISDNEKPVVAFIGRLDPQKGLELIRHALFYTLHRNGQFILLGSSPDTQINNYFWGLKHQLNENPDCHLEIGFNEELSHLIYAGADMIIVPSRFEPCGLTQMIAMRYGSIPVVREVGGLADTVFDKDFSHRPLHERNGYVFRDYDFGGLESALGRAISCYYEFPEHFRELMRNAMRYDFSWNHPGQDYLNIYDFIREK